MFSALEALINFAYNGHLAIDQQNVQSLLMGASFLQLQNIKDACCSFLRERWGALQKAELVESQGWDISPKKQPHAQKSLYNTRHNACIQRRWAKPHVYKGNLEPLCKWDPLFTNCLKVAISRIASFVAAGTSFFVLFLPPSQYFSGGGGHTHTCSIFGDVFLYQVKR